MRRPSRSFEIALSAIACAVAAVALTVGAWVDVLLPSGYLIAIFALMVPLSRDHFVGAALACVGAFLLAFCFSGGIFQLLPFIAFFGLHPIVNRLQMKYVRKTPLHLVCFLGKAVWFDLAVWLAWEVVLVPIFGVDSATWYPFVMRYFFIVLFVGGTLFFAVYDFMIRLCQRSVNAIVRRIGRSGR